jgi:hypothetical protein
MTTSVSAAGGELVRYDIEVRGPLGNYRFECTDPCEFDETEEVGNAGGGIAVDQVDGTNIRTNSLARRKSSRSYAEDNITCIGDCVQQGPTNMITIGSVRHLTEGVEVRIREGRARFVFHSLIEEAEGPITRRRVSQFRIDRPLIELELSDHAVVIRQIEPSGAE